MSVHVTPATSSRNARRSRACGGIRRRGDRKDNHDPIALSRSTANMLSPLRLSHGQHIHHGSFASPDAFTRNSCGPRASLGVRSTDFTPRRSRGSSRWYSWNRLCSANPPSPNGGLLTHNSPHCWEEHRVVEGKAVTSIVCWYRYSTWCILVSEKRTEITTEENFFLSF